MTASRLSSVVVVLVEPQDPVNIGATVRAMGNMGVSRLRVVRPVPYEPRRLEGIAHGAMDMIQAIERFDDFDSAVADCVSVMGFTARRRSAKQRQIDAKRAARELLQAGAGGGPVAMVFGREDSGLPNEILDRMHALVTIPTTERSALNLAQAVLIGLYELHLAAGDATHEWAPPRKTTPPPTNELLERFFAEAERSLEAIQFMKTRYPEHIMRTLRSLTHRADPDARELSLLRAMVLEVTNYLRRTGRLE